MFVLHCKCIFMPDHMYSHKTDQLVFARLKMNTEQTMAQTMEKTTTVAS